MKDTKADSLLPTVVVTKSLPSKGKSITSTLCLSSSLFFLTAVGLLLVHQNIQLGMQVRNMKDVLGKVVMVLNIMNNRVAEVEMDIVLIKEDVEIELYDEETSTVSPEYLEDLINIEENEKDESINFKKRDEEKVIEMNEGGTNYVEYNEMYEDNKTQAAPSNEVVRNGNLSAYRRAVDYVTESTTTTTKRSLTDEGAVEKNVNYEGFEAEESFKETDGSVF